MRIYHGTQDNMIYLSPYTTVWVGERELVIRSTLFATTVSLPCSGAQGEALLSLLQQGIEETALRDHFRRELPQVPVGELMEEWMRQGVLE